jgi:hypothetical protein
MRLYPALTQALRRERERLPGEKEREKESARARASEPAGQRASERERERERGRGKERERETKPRVLTGFEEGASFLCTALTAWFLFSILFGEESLLTFFV